MPLACWHRRQTLKPVRLAVVDLPLPQLADIIPRAPQNENANRVFHLGFSARHARTVFMVTSTGRSDLVQSSD